ncbi:MAG: hypothetical protein AB7U24_07935 [Sulfurimonadaceae bacterium]
MQNPFETGHIKNYILLYASIVVIMILFFIAASLFHEPKAQERKVFDTNASKLEKVLPQTKEENNETQKRFTVLRKGY